MILSAPVSFIFKDEIVKVDPPVGTDPYSLDISLEITKIKSSNKFININASLLRATASDKPVTLELNVETRAIFQKKENYVNKETSHFMTSVTFPAGSTQSNQFNYYLKGLSSHVGYDSILIESQVTTSKPEDISMVTGFDFSWFFGNSASMKYRQYSGVFLSISLIIIFVGYIYSIRLEKTVIIEVLCLIFSSAGILTMNPLSFFVSDLSVNVISSSVLLAVFVASFRLFIAVDYYYSGISVTVNSVYLLFTTLFYTVGAIISSCASYDRNMPTSQNKTEPSFFPTSEKIQIAFDAVNLIFSIIMCIYILVKSGLQSRQVIMICLITLITQSATIFCHIILPITHSKYMSSIVPELLFLMIHMTCAALSLHFMQPYEGIEYSHMDEANNNKGDDNIEIDVQEPEDTLDPEDPEPANN